MATTINSINFVRTKGGHVSAIINNAFSVVKREDSEEKYFVYNNISRGSEIESTPELVTEFTNAFFKVLEEKARQAEEQERIEREEEAQRIQKIKDDVKGMTPSDFCQCYNIEYTETAHHWNDLYTGRSSFAMKISSDEELELVEIASDVNNWGGEYGELTHRAGEHHSTFDSVFDLDYYREKVSNYFSDKYFFRSKETEEESTLERIKEAESMDEIREIMSEFDELEEGYYSNGGSLVYSGDISEYWGYSHDVYTYCFGYKLPSKTVFYDGMEEDESEDLDNFL